VTKPKSIIDTKFVSIQLISPASGDPSILNPYGARCPEAVSEGQEKRPTKRQKTSDQKP
jgi:hypothetical protein